MGGFLDDANDLKLGGWPHPAISKWMGARCLAFETWDILRRMSIRNRRSFVRSFANTNDRTRIATYDIDLQKEDT